MARKPITKANPYTPKRGQFAGRTFYTERGYRNALARAKGLRSWSEQQRQARTVRSASDVARLRSSEQEARARSLDALSRMRHDGLPLGKAAKAAHTTAAAVQRHAGSALEKTPGGRYRAKHDDRLVRPMLVPTRNGPVTLDIRNSRSASLVGAYWSAVRHYLETGNERPLRRFRGKGVTVNKRFYPLITDLDVLDALGDAGELRFDSVYELSRAA